MYYISDRITISPDICNGKPTIRGIRITVQTILEYLKAGETIDSILEQYPSLEKEDISACWEFAVKSASNQLSIVEFQ
ncbi:MAG: hypothetical protein HW421_1121 [Ignavibacteria bacterium]|nr:hypothetical protein [Ignavibacteria bacterium]